MGDPDHAGGGGDRTLLLVVGGLALAVAVGTCLVGALLFAIAADEPTALPDPSPVDPGPIDGLPPDPTDPTSTPAPDEPMPPRYRPGPFVQVEGFLPDGRLAAAPPSLAGTQRTGRTIDNPWIVGGAELRPGPAPDAGTPPATPALGIVGTRPDQRLTILAGVPNRLPVDADAAPGENGEVQGLFIAFHGYSGHFFLPATVDTELGPVHVAGVDGTEVHFGIDSPQRPDGTPLDSPYELTMYVAAVDVAGRVSPYTQQRLLLMPVGTGDVEVTVTMTRSTDLDLYVLDPAGAVVYYGNTSVASGGQLDLDANAACGGNMGVDNEHIYWPRGAAPAGRYSVRVANYESCIGGDRVDYRVTVRNCGETAVFSGYFDGPGRSESCDRPPGTDRGWCQEVVEFDVTPCAPAIPLGGPVL